ncbi:MAG: type II RES/Xre toxin-antitoxin system antitoxin [Gemmatimonadales bacterium]
MTSVADVAKWLGGKKLLKSNIRSEFDFVRLVQGGLPTAALEALVARGDLTAQEVEKYIIPRRTLAHRKRRHQPLSGEESDKLARVARIFTIAQETFQDREKASTWLRRPNRALRGVAPVELLNTDSGARVVEQTLERIAYGVFS